MEETISFDNYSNQQVLKLYHDAMCDEIRDKRLERIKHALHEIVHLGQYNRDSFEYLVDVLYSLPNSAIKDIESGNFSTLYKAYYNHTISMPEDYYEMTDLLGAIYTDYENSSNDEYSWLCDDCMSLIYNIHRFNNPKIDKSLSRANYDLSILLKNTLANTNYKKLKTKRTTIKDNQARIIIKTHLLVTFLKNIKEYGYQYRVPVDLFNLLIDKVHEDSIIKIAEYLKYGKNSYDLSKEIIDIYCFGDSKLDSIADVKDRIRLLELKD